MNLTRLDKRKTKSEGDRNSTDSVQKCFSILHVCREIVRASIVTQQLVTAITIVSDFICCNSYHCIKGIETLPITDKVVNRKSQ